MQTFEDCLLAWHDQNARDLPWRGERDPYRIWVSEIMLQQTRTETVAGYYRAFLEDFPDVHALACATQDQVFKRWEGLGYYARARNLLKAAKIISEEFGGQLPKTVKELMRLPGIGDYTSAAIASMAFGCRALAMDGNAVRVLSRVCAEKRCVGELAVRRSLKEAGLSLMSERRPGDFNQAMMGLGNLICVPRHPRCALCPVRNFCRAQEMGIQEELPHLGEKLKKQVVPVGVALVFCHHRVLLIKRPNQGLLAGLDAFPAFEGAKGEADVRAALKEMVLDVQRGEALGEAEHIFTHRVWKMKGWRYDVRSLPEEFEARMADADALERAALPTALRVWREKAAQWLNDESVFQQSGNNTSPSGVEIIGR